MSAPEMTKEQRDLIEVQMETSAVMKAQAGGSGTMQ